MNAAFLSSEDFFDFDKYLEWQEERSQRNRDNNIEFIRQLIQTQGFHKFIEQTSLGGKEQTESMAVFFEMNIELLNESSLKRLKAA